MTPRTYVVREIFDTIQGEGARAGTRAVFLRLAGCNGWNGIEADRHKGPFACSRWCDTDFVGGERMTLPMIRSRLDGLWPCNHLARDRNRWVVLTGGEPALQVDQELLDGLHEAGWSIAMETNGTRDPAAFSLVAGDKLLDHVDHLCVSPKLGGKLERLRAHELKVVVPGVVPDLHALRAGAVDHAHGWDLASLDALLATVIVPAGALYLQPQDSPNERARALYQQLAVEMVRHDPRWRLSLQTHKFLGLP